MYTEFYKHPAAVNELHKLTDWLFEKVEKGRLDRLDIQNIRTFLELKLDPMDKRKLGKVTHV